MNKTKAGARNPAEEQRSRHYLTVGNQEKKSREPSLDCRKDWGGDGGWVEEEAWIHQSWRPEISVASARKRKLTIKGQLCYAICHSFFLSLLSTLFVHYQLQWEGKEKIKDKKQSLRNKQLMPLTTGDKGKEGIANVYTITVYLLYLAVYCTLISITGTKGGKGGWRTSKESTEECGRKPG